jgi:Raf kinase inhibitor-like YbhB/YbcL family protein
MIQTSFPAFVTKILSYLMRFGKCVPPYKKIFASFSPVGQKNSLWHNFVCSPGVNTMKLILILIVIMTTLVTKTLTVKSPAFNNNGFIPSVHTCDGNNVNPEITFGQVPGDTKSLALVMEDPDAPKGTFDHWIMWNIPPEAKIASNSAPGIQGKNGKNENGYTGPCPPSGEHHYHFKVFALDKKLDLKEGASKEELVEAMKGHIIAKGELIGIYKRK